MTSLLLPGVFVIALTSMGIYSLLKALKMGVFERRSRFGYRKVRIERQQEPGKYWSEVSFMAVVVGIAFYFGLAMLSEAL